MEHCTEIRPDIFRLEVPFENIYTTVFFIRTDTGFLLFDTATYDSDTDQYILPAMKQLGITPKALRYVCLSHSHRDHAGGLSRLMQFCPDTCILSHREALRKSYAAYSTADVRDNTVILQDLRILTVPGHDADCIAILDTRSNTLLTGDCLQVYGIYGSGDWGTNITMRTAHREALQKLRRYSVETLIASHAYHPYGYMAEGKEAVEQYYTGCEEALETVKEAVRSHPEMDDKEIAIWYHQTTRLPRTGAHVFAAARKELLYETE